MKLFAARVRRDVNAHGETEGGTTVGDVATEEQTESGSRANMHALYWTAWIER